VKIPIFTDEPGWQGLQLQQAFSKHDVEAVFVSLQDCCIDLSQPMPKIVVPGFSNLPQAAFVRGVAGGSLQQVITRLNVLHMLQRLSVRVYNQPQAIERTVDKGMTSFLLKQHGVMTPATWVAESRAHITALRQNNTEQYPMLVLKPLFGSQGKGVRMLQAADTLPIPMLQHVDGVYYLQQFIKSAKTSHDYRVMVVAGKAIAAMKRHGIDWVNNVAFGAQCEYVELSDQLAELAVKAAHAVDIDYCGVDIIQAENGDFYVLEVNSIPAWRGLQNVTDFNIAEVLVKDLLGKLAK
jgi:RimK family alpha-L-glutamate ligase